jgi:hypothetical protein
VIRLRSVQWSGRVAAVLVLAVLAGCTSARSSLGTSDSPCYQALPSAVASVRHTGRLVGVDLTSLKRLDQESPPIARALGGGRSPERVCTIAFAGRFEAGSVADPRGRTTGHFAVVVLTNPADSVLGTVILDHAPFRFGHPFVG